MGESGRSLETEFARLLNDAHRELFGFIFAVLQNRSDAEDVYQQTALVMWRKFSQFTAGTSFIAWAIRVAQFEIMDHVKARRRQKVYFNDAILQAVAVTYQSRSNHAQSLRADALSRCLDKLNDRDRGLLKQCYTVDSSYEEIARNEGKSLNAVYKAISRIRKALYLCVTRTLAAEGDA